MVTASLPAMAQAKGKKSENGSVADDPAARRLLAAAEERSERWQDFPGFTAQISVYRDGQTFSGHVTVAADGKVRVHLEDGESRKWAEQTLTSVALNALREPFEKRYQGKSISFGKDDLHPLGQLVEVHGDAYSSRYRVRDGEIREIERSTREQRLTIEILSIDRHPEHGKQSQSFVVYYREPGSDALRSSEAVVDERVPVGGFNLPSLWLETRIGRGQPSTTSVTLRGHQLLPVEPAVASRTGRKP